MNNIARACSDFLCIWESLLGNAGTLKALDNIDHFDYFLTTGVILSSG